MTQGYTHKVGDLVASVEEHIDGTALTVRVTVGVIVSDVGGLSPFKVDWSDGEYNDEYYTEKDIEAFKKDLKELQRKRRKR